MGGFANILGSVLYGKRSGGVVKPNPRTLGTFNGKLYQPPPDPGNPITLGPDSGYTPEQADLRATIARPPQEGVKPDGTKIGGLRRVLGTIASNVGPLIGGPAVAGIGEKLLHPGLDKWNSDVVRKQALAQMSVDARNHQDLEANRQAMRDARTDALQTRQDTLNEQQRQHALGQVEQIRKDGGREIEDAPTLPETRQALRPQMPTAVGQPAPPPQIVPQNVQGPSPVEQIDDETGKPMSQVGRVQEIAVPGQAKPTRMVRYSAQTKREMAAADLKSKTAATKETWEALPPEMASALNLAPDTKVPSLAPYAQMYEAKLKDNNLHFESNTNDETGDVTTRGFDAKTGEVKFAHTAKGEAKKRPQVSILNAANARGDKSYQFNIGELNNARKPVDEAVGRLGRLQDTIAQGNMQADALVAPELLTVMAGGAGSGLRMNEAEIARIIGGRTQYENLKAFLQKWNTDPNAARSITPDQEKQIKKLVSTVHSKLLAKQGVLTEARKALIDSEDPGVHRQAVATALEKLAAIDGSSDGGASAPGGGIPQVGQTFNGSKVLKVTPITSK